MGQNPDPIDKTKLDESAGRREILDTLLKHINPLNGNMSDT